MLLTMCITFPKPESQAGINFIKVKERYFGIRIISCKLVTEFKFLLQLCWLTKLIMLNVMMRPKVTWRLKRLLKMIRDVVQILNTGHWKSAV